VLIFLAFARRPKRGFRVAGTSKKFLAPEFLLTEPRRVPPYSHQLSDNKALFLRGAEDFWLPPQFSGSFRVKPCDTQNDPV
jgi:hypothetical protein